MMVANGAVRESLSRYSTYLDSLQIQYNLRPCTEADIPALIYLNRLLQTQYTREGWEKYITGRRFKCFIERDRKGFIVAKHESEEVLLVAIAVEPPFRLQGLGRALINYIHKHFGECLQGKVRVSNPAIKFYQKIGFEIVGRLTQYYSNGEDAFLIKFCEI